MLLFYVCFTVFSASSAEIAKIPARNWGNKLSNVSR